ncbi:MAG: hypothetical protein LC687_00950 [Actinobacteria bacterium]|nr:hypothetical protein [Actinomycetota bacterium]
MSWEYASSKLGNVKPATRSIAKELYDAAEAAGHEIWFIWGMGPSSEHSTGRALDLMVRNKDAGDFLRNYVWKNRKRLRLQHVIWWQAITSTVTRPGVVRRMSDRGNSTANHKDHPHILVLPGAYQPPENSTPKKATTGLVSRIQDALEAGTDGLWGPLTDQRALTMRTAAKAKRGWPSINPKLVFNVRDVQSIIDTQVDNIWGPKSQEALVTWIKNFQKILGAKADGYWGPKTDTRFINVRRRYLNKC